jgi:DNA repair protein RecN (Recombination protein N)
VLHELRIENLLLIERAELRFASGLNAITGETGAGKTILAHSLDLLLGGKARPQIVRPQAHEAYVEGAFGLSDALLADPELAELRERLPDGDDEIVLGRRISAGGRTSAFIQGRTAPASDLRAIGSRLVAFYGQHEHRKLILSSAQLEFLDGLAGGTQLERLARYKVAHAEVALLAAELAELRDRAGSRERELDLLRYELGEIEAVAPDLEEERRLEEERNRLRHTESLRAAASSALSAIAGEEEGVGGASGLLRGAEAELAATSGLDTALGELTQRISEATLELEDGASGLRAYLDAIEAEPGRIEEVDELQDLVGAELAELAMEGASVDVSLDAHPDGFGPDGSEMVELRIATNPGLPAAPLRDAASGGELSRIMLALAGLVPGTDERTRVFDEIDAGIGGNTARVVGERLRRLGERQQVICITHLPQVASRADAHFRISKRAERGRSWASVERVDGEELVAEIVRMLGAARDDEAASRHARELLAAA